MQERKAIKQLVKNWKPDYLRACLSSDRTPVSALQTCRYRSQASSQRSESALIDYSVFRAWQRGCS